ncbi:ABC transporter permease [Bacterioplanes sanyensis]|uniref:ABC transporter permease n=1 Tax=Bacterioplanes sanyensis TaxID=1249553 RepID=UPI0012FD56EE|nr:ABC transporter permease [Bacterioplanes sanyensis]
MRSLLWSWLTLLSHYRRHPSQTLFLLLGLITGVALWSAVHIINAHARASYAEADLLLDAQASHWIQSPQGRVDLNDYVALRRAGFRQVYPVLELRLSTPDNQPLTLIATDLMAMGASRTSPTEAQSNSRVDMHAWSQLSQPPYAVWVPASLANSLPLQAGQRLTLRDGRQLPPAVIDSQPRQGQRLFMDIGAAAITLGETHLSYLAVGAINPAELKRLDQWLGQYAPQLKRRSNQQPLDLTELTASLHIHLNAMSLLAFAVGLFIVFNAVRFALHSRASTLTTLRELGVSARTLTSAIMLEGFTLSLIGTALGLAAGFGLSQLLLPAVAATLQHLYGAVLDQRLLLQPQVLLQAWLLTSVGLLMALVWPLWQRSRQDVLAQRQGIDLLQQEQRSQRRLAISSLVLLALALLSYPWLRSLAHGFALLAVLLFAGAWLLPWLASQCLHGLSQNAKPGLAQWCWAEGQVQLGPLRPALMAMLLALTANFGVDNLVGSFRQALDNWLQQRIAADVYVQSEQLDAHQLSQHAWLLDSHQRNGLRLRWQERPTLIRGLDPSAPDVQQLPMASQSYPPSQNYPQSGAAWPDDGILANEQVQHLAGKQLGDVIYLPLGNGEQQRFTLAGFYYDYGNPYFQFYLPYQRVAQLWPSAQPQGLALWLNEDANMTEVEQALVEAGAQPGDWIDRRAILQLSLRIFDRTFAMTAAINTLTFAVAGIALLAALLAIHQQRLPHYAHWRAMGVSWREWLQLTAVPLALCLMLTWALSIPLGSALAWLLIHDINVLSFGWTMPLQWQGRPALLLALLCLGVTAIAFAIAALQVRQRLPYALKQLGADE